MLTVKDVYNNCKQLIDKGYGDKFLLVTDDEEGNGYHGLYYLADTDIESFKILVKNGMIHEDLDINSFIIMG